MDTPAACFSALILCGGKSSRMGTDKARLRLGPVSVIEYQTEKLRALGFRDILLCGYSGSVPGAVSVPDIYTGKGPLGGIYAGLSAAAHENCFVISVDVPLLPPQLIAAMLRSHRAGTITLLEHNGHTEPLIGIYPAALARQAGEILQEEHTAVRRLTGCAECIPFTYQGDEQYLLNCNTPQDYARILQLYAAQDPA